MCSENLGIRLDFISGTFSKGLTDDNDRDLSLVNAILYKLYLCLLMYVAASCSADKMFPLNTDYVAVE